MSNLVHQRWTLTITALGALLSIITINLTVGRGIGSIEERIATLQRGSDVKATIDERQNAQISELQKGQAVVESRLHGISSAVEQVPGKVAAKLLDEN